MAEFHVAVGEETSFAKTIGESDIYGFAGITGDFAAPHLNEEYMKASPYGHRVAHGAMLVGFMSTASAMMANRVMHPGSRVTPMSVGYDRVRFTAPVYIGDTVTVTYRISEIDPARNRSRAALTAVNQNGETVGVAEHIMQWVPNA